MHYDCGRALATYEDYEGKMQRIGSRYFRMAIAAVAAAILIADAAIASDAGMRTDPFPPPPPPPPIPSNFAVPPASDTNAKCRQSELTQDKFLDMLRAIAMRGDLTDSAFLEKTLQVKFKHLQGDAGIPGRQVYTADFLQGPSITVFLDFNSYHRKHEKPEWVTLGRLGFGLLDMAAINFHDCGVLTAEELTKKFGGAFIETKISGCKQLDKVGNYAPISIFYKSSRNGVINIIDIENSFVEQSVPRVDSFQCQGRAQ